MLKRILGLAFGDGSPIVLYQTLGMLEKKESVLAKKATIEVEKAKEFTKAKNKRVKERISKICKLNGKDCTKSQRSRYIMESQQNHYQPSKKSSKKGKLSKELITRIIIIK